TFTNAMNLIGFLPDRGNRYAYHIGGANWQLRSSASVATTSVDTHGYRVDTFRYPAAIGGTSPTVVVLPAAPICNSGWTATGTAAAVVTGNRGSFLASAAGNVDTDTGIDSWWVSSCTLSVTTASACREVQSATQGVPANAYNDVICP
ncbi:MAG: hypothetical protein JNG84_07570, partial [Archangium sp.]|nr:hypothetical protein [Archangium sp.]